jgi:thiol-disulfide isomerase/thioredoxin
MRSALVAVVALVALAGCAADPAEGPEAVPQEVRGPFVACGTSTGGGPLTLPCFADGAALEVPPAGKPAVLTLWASSCEPCRRELPAFQGLWDKASDKVTVLGVVTEDTRTAAASLAEDLSITFPSVYDREGRFRKELGRSALPVTLFVDSAGKIVYSHVSGALDDAQLNQLVRDKLGVALA